VCAFFDSRDEEYQMLLPFLKDGLEGGEKEIHVVDPALRGDHLARLDAAGIDVAMAQRRRQLEVLDWDDAYLRGGSFDGRATTLLLADMLTRARAEGFPRVRVVGHMEWALQDPSDLRALAEYETGVNDAFRRYDDPLVCVYDRARFGAGTAADVLRAHAKVILDGTLHTNPSFLPSAWLLPSLRGPTLAVLRDRYLGTLLAGAWREALDIAVEEALCADVPVASVYLDVVQPALYEIGRLWRQRRISVAREHLATELSRTVLAHLRDHLPGRRRNGKRVAVACVEGELHDLGARMVADFFEMDGFEVRFLGANVPAAALAQLVREQAPDVMALSATTSTSVTAMRRAVVAVRSVADRRMLLAAGGQLFRHTPGLGTQLGIDLDVDDLRGMAAVAARMLDDRVQ
jgi:MerR family transcriptional regulator, light-induced transcriptional regulator